MLYVLNKAVLFFIRPPAYMGRNLLAFIDANSHLNHLEQVNESGEPR